MFKPPSRTVGGSTQVEAEKFGDHITADFIVTRDEDELGIDDEKKKSALVVKPMPQFWRSNILLDILKKAESFTVSIRPELISAMKILQCRHVLSRDYISKSNAQAERAVRSVLEGARVNLLQGGLNHWHWPHAARRWCLTQNILGTGGNPSPWELRFGSKFIGPLTPFGRIVDYWNGPSLRFDPTSSPGLSLGYAIHAEFMWRKEVMVIPTKDLIENEANGTASVLRVLKINKPGKTQYPLQGRSTFGKDEPGLTEAVGNQEPTLEDQDAKMDEPESSRRDDFQLSAHAVHDETWLPFMRHIKDREGWYEYAGCQVNVKRDSEAYISPRDKFSVEEFPYRTTCHRKDDAWFLLEQNFIMWPKYEDWSEAVATCEVMFTSFSKSIIDLRQRSLPS